MTTGVPLADELFAKSLEHKDKRDKEEYEKLIAEIKQCAKGMTRGETKLAFQRQLSAYTLKRLREENKFTVEEKHYQGRSDCGCDHGCSGCTSVFTTVIDWDRSKKEAPKSASAAPATTPAATGAVFPKCHECGSVVAFPEKSEFEGICLCSKACVHAYRNYGAFQGGKRPIVGDGGVPITMPPQPAPSSAKCALCSAHTGLKILDGSGPWFCSKSCATEAMARLTQKPAAPDIGFVEYLER